MSISSSAAVTSKGARLVSTAFPEKWTSGLPDLCELLMETNGLVIFDGLFRVFGVGSGCHGRDGLVWNTAPWRALYSLPEAVVLWGESVFGDQYGVNTASGEVLELVCEGATLERLPFESATDFVENGVLIDPNRWLDRELFDAAARGEIRASPMEHLCFALPLVCGGSPTIDNIEVMEAAAHLDVLGQIIAQSEARPEGARIDRFRAK